jgi:tRNA threonylcarbamoyladenosine biosynthesis protein TsaB
MNARLVLAIDTATAPGGVAVGASSGGVLAEVVLEMAPRHSAMLLPAIEQALRQAGGSIADVDALIVGAGPGSFTGVRIAAATAKGLVHARGMTLYAVSSLLAAACAAHAGSRAVCTLFDARRGEAYAGCWRAWDGEVETVLEPTAARVDDIVARLAAYDPLYVGDGAQRNRAAIVRAGASVGAPYATLHCARALLMLHEMAGPANLVERAAAWQPSYVRAPNVTVPK